MSINCSNMSLLKTFTLPWLHSTRKSCSWNLLESETVETWECNEMTKKEYLMPTEVLLCETQLKHKTYIYFWFKLLYFLFFNKRFPLGLSIEDLISSVALFPSSFFAFHVSTPRSISEFRYTALFCQEQTKQNWLLYWEYYLITWELT